MPWKMVSEGRFERPLGETEKLLWLIGASAFAFGKDEWHLFTTARLHLGCEALLGDEAVAALRKAWKSLRFEHPSIAVITDGATLTYDVPDVSSLEQWADKTFIVDRDTEEAEDVIASIGPCEQAQLHVLPHTRQIVLHTAHWRSDGRGLPQLLDRLLHFMTHPQLSSLRWGEETSRLTICLEDAANMIDQVSPADQARVKEMAGQLLKGSPALTISCIGDTDTQPGSPRRCLLSLTALQTAALISTCRARNLTVTAAVHAAIATTNIAHATLSSKGLDYRSSIRRDLRARLKEPHNSPASAAALFNTATIFSLPADGTWTDFAKHLTDEYRGSYDDEQFRLHRVYYRQLVADITHAATESSGTARAADVDISSIGLVENLLRREYGEGPGLVQVEDMAVSVNTCSRQAAVFVFTFRDCLNLYMTYNEAFYAREYMKRFLTEIKERLVAELGIGD
ncbi:hypothetical protein IMSHALPRED_006887 [Imshaugia aleurites]|uniref:Condensation domain-containing protein n=1 Tax=Imshaugia aleurites TaxID=172621 RepID=A0A8H3FRX3_9LECA|nr:hypothetical protein IMSHALPRED_006887 [Imshaugia aleurites]